MFLRFQTRITQDDWSQKSGTFGRFLPPRNLGGVNETSDYHFQLEPMTQTLMYFRRDSTWRAERERSCKKDNSGKI